MTNTTKMKTIHLTLAIVTLMALSPRGHAELILSLDARRGATDEAWSDLSGMNEPFRPVGNAVLGQGAYTFDGNDHFVGNTADETNFDFETAKAGTADPFIAVVYFRPDQVKPDVGMSDGSLVNKAANLQGPGWMLSTRVGPLGNPDAEPNTSSFWSANIVQQPNLSTKRALSRPQESLTPDTDWHLFVFEVDGSGVAPEGHSLFADGATDDLLDSSPFGDALSASVLNDSALRVGGAVDANGLVGELRFVEIYSGTTVDNNLVKGMTASEYSQYRIENLDEIVTAVDDECDYNGDGVLDIEDLNLLLAAVKSGDNDPTFDVNLDGVVNRDDIQFYVEDSTKLNTFVGDADLSGEFNSSDLVQVFQANQYEDNNPGDPSTIMNSSWATGDWDGDAEFSSSDLVFAFERGGYTAGAAAAPEPSAVTMLTIAALAFAILRRRSRGVTREF